jgi:hypothetical protein
MVLQAIVFCLVLALVAVLAIAKSTIGILVFGGVVVARLLLTQLFPVHTQQAYARAAEKWSTGLPLAHIGVMDMIGLFGSILVCLASFFILGIVRGLVFSVVVILLLIVPGAMYGRQLSKALQRKR